MYTVQIEVFEGPMELLLHLVEKNQLDIYTVSISAITDQFIDYVKRSSAIELENIGEFMVIASLLMRIKIKQLLPTMIKADEDEDSLEAEEQALVERLIEYRMFKEVAGYLEERMEGRVNRVYYRAQTDDDTFIPPDPGWSASLEQLVRAYLALEKDIVDVKPVWELVPQNDVDVDKMMEWLQLELQVTCHFQDLWRHFVSRRQRVALFLALLELIHRGKVEACQEPSTGAIVLANKEVAAC